MPGTLYLVGTPIGNLEDISFRALKILGEADIIAAEDTRHTRNLLNHFSIQTPLTSYFEHNKRTKGDFILSLLGEGKTVALVSDAGMPGISDPGEDIARDALAAGFQVLPVPGPSAALAALVVSGLSTARFVFEGFLPRDKKERRERLEFLQNEERTMIFYEAPHRLTASLEELQHYFGERQVAAAREITKRFEETVRGTLPQVIKHFQEQPPRGEFTLVLAGAPRVEKKQPEEQEITEELKIRLAAGMSKKEAVKEVADALGISKSGVYKLSLEI